MCKVDHVQSKQTNIKCGITQGSTWGPLHFLIYIDYLPNCVTCSTTGTFADDINLSTTGKSIIEVEDKLNASLVSVHQWLMADKLTPN